MGEGKEAPHCAQAIVASFVEVWLQNSQIFSMNQTPDK
jgi:hypothetical protein